MHIGGLASLALCFLGLPVLAQSDQVFRPPTDNDRLFHGDEDGFYMYCDRYFEGVKSQPWQAGSYGFVRNPFRASDGSLMYSRLHEGIDVKPLKRDARGEPLDEVRPVAPGTVVYVNNSPGGSNYGRYVVVEHNLPEGNIYTLYAHLASVACEVGQPVGTGSKLGVMGHTGVGLDRVRSHVHLEICLMINSGYDRMVPKGNLHGNYNGLNLIGFDISPLLLVCKDGEPISLKKHFETLKEHYRVRVPRIGTMDLLRRHPFLYKGKRGSNPTALDIAFTAEGVPIAVYPSKEHVTEPVIIKCEPMPTLQQNCTLNRVKNSSKNAALTASGKRYIQQYLWLEEVPKPPAPKDEGQQTEEQPAPSQP